MSSSSAPAKRVQAPSEYEGISGTPLHVTAEDLEAMGLEGERKGPPRAKRSLKALFEEKGPVGGQLGRSAGRSWLRPKVSHHSGHSNAPGHSEGVERSGEELEGRGLSLPFSSDGVPSLASGTQAFQSLSYRPQYQMPSIIGNQGPGPLPHGSNVDCYAANGPHQPDEYLTSKGGPAVQAMQGFCLHAPGPSRFVPVVHRVDTSITHGAHAIPSNVKQRQLPMLGEVEKPSKAQGDSELPSGIPLQNDEPCEFSLTANEEMPLEWDPCEPSSCAEDGPVGVHPPTAAAAASDSGYNGTFAHAMGWSYVDRRASANGGQQDTMPGSVEHRPKPLAPANGNRPLDTAGAAKNGATTRKRSRGDVTDIDQ